MYFIKKKLHYKLYSFNQFIKSFYFLVYKYALFKFIKTRQRENKNLKRQK